MATLSAQLATWGNSFQPNSKRKDDAMHSVAVVSMVIMNSTHLYAAVFKEID
jgi:hypothetical protein